MKPLLDLNKILPGEKIMEADRFNYILNLFISYHKSHPGFEQERKQNSRKALAQFTADTNLDFNEVLEFMRAFNKLVGVAKIEKVIKDLDTLGDNFTPETD